MGTGDLALCGCALFIIALWLLLHPYAGIQHDAILYTLLAMARLHPGPLGYDFAVRFGAQDQYTVFSPLYATAIQRLGIDHAAALLTLLSQATFLCSAWSIARRLSSTRLAFLGLGLLIILPSWYGAGRTFSYLEPFLTPRQPAEAFVLAGTAFILYGRRAWALACMAIAITLHPIMAGAGILFWIIYEFGPSHPRVILTAWVSILCLCLLVAMLPDNPLSRFDDEWLAALQARMTFMFPSRWTMRDWSWSLPGLLILSVGAMAGERPRLRHTCIAALATAVSGIILCAAGGDLLHIRLAVQMQAWRWLWLSGALSVALLPAVIADAWQHATATRERELPPKTELKTARPISIFLFATGLISATASAAHVAGSWTFSRYTPAREAAYEPWRRIIPESAEVLWPDSPPLDLWYSLHRASYWSLEQMSGSVFSRREWAIGMRRQTAVLGLVPLLGGQYQGIPFRPESPTPSQGPLTTACAAPDLQYLVSWRDLGPTRYPTLTFPNPHTGEPGILHLYSCGMSGQ